MDFVGGVPDEPGDDVRRLPSWTIARLIGLLEVGIDTAGAQLARSAGLSFDWTDDDAVLVRRVRRVDPRSADHLAYEEPESRIELL
ncbi:hypothetical protein GCM10009534_35230 [Kribbella sandramycini]